MPSTEQVSRETVTTMQSGLVYRSAFIKREAINEEARTVDLTFSTDAPVERWDGLEVLDHSPGAVMTERLQTGAASLKDHDWTKQVGKVESFEIDSKAGQGRAVVRFGRSSVAEEEWVDVKDGIRVHVSVGYRIHEMVLESETDGVRTYRVTLWEPYEISFVAVPADLGAGVGRSSGGEQFEIRVRSMIMAEQAEGSNNTNPPADGGERGATPPATTQGANNPPAGQGGERVSVETVRGGEIKRIRDCTEMGTQYRQYEGEQLADTAIREGWSLDRLRAAIMEKVPTAARGTTGDVPAGRAGVQGLGASDGEVRQYSFNAALARMALGAKKVGGFEEEVSRAFAQQLGVDPEGMFVPFDMRSLGAGIAMQRDLTTLGTDTGDVLMHNEEMPGIIDLLRDRLVVSRLGVQTLSGLNGKLSYVRQTGGLTVFWVGESEDTGESDPQFDNISSEPRTMGAMTGFTRELLMQTSYDVEAYSRLELARAFGQAVDWSVLLGDGAVNVDGAQVTPRGVLNTTGITPVVIGDNGGEMGWPHVVRLETAVSDNNADVGKLGYVTNARVRGSLKERAKFTNGNTPVWGDGDRPLNGYQAEVTNMMPRDGVKGTGTGLSSMVFGNWEDVVLGFWGVVDLTVDNLTMAKKRIIKVIAHNSLDVTVLRPQSFAYCDDIQTPGI